MMDIIERIRSHIQECEAASCQELEPDPIPLLLSCRDEIIAARACAEMMLQGTGQAQCEALLDRVIEANYPTRWISVDEQVPEEAKEVLAYADGRRCNAEFWRSEWWHACQGFEKRGGRMLKRVTHWMPLPAPPADGK